MAGQAGKWLKALHQRTTWLETKAAEREAAGLPTTLFRDEARAIRYALACVELVRGYGWAGLTNFGYPLLGSQFAVEHETFHLGRPLEARPPRYGFGGDYNAGTPPSVTEGLWLDWPNNGRTR